MLLLIRRILYQYIYIYINPDQSILSNQQIEYSNVLVTEYKSVLVALDLN